MENQNVAYPVTLSLQQVQAIEANRLDKNSVTLDDFRYVSRSWRIAEAENASLRKQLQQEKKSVIKRIREIVNWSAGPKKKVGQTSIPGFEMELTVFGLTAVAGIANMASIMLA